MSAFIIYAVIIGYLGLTMYLANQHEVEAADDRSVRLMLYIAAGMVFILGPYVGLIALSSAQLAELAEQGEDVFVPDISGLALLVSIVLTTAAGTVSYVMTRSLVARGYLERLIGDQGAFRADSLVHAAAVVLALLLLTGSIVLFIVEGGTSGMAETIEAGGVPVGLPLFQAALQIAAAFLGVGLAIRRTLPQALQRLGLRIPQREDLTWGAGIGLALFGVLIVYGSIVALFFSAEQLEAQNEAAQSLAQAFSTLPLALLLASSAAVGEEIFFRGALQPVFGNLLTSIFFALMHTQVLLSPGVILIFIVSLGLGWLRERFSTTAAVIGHFVYNFIQLLLLSLAMSMGAA